MSFQGNKDVRVQGSSISLAPTGVTPGTYNQVQVDANGRVLVGGGGSGTPVSGTVTVALSGDASGSASGSGANPTITVPATLDTVNSNVGTFQGLTVNAKGLVTAAANQGYLTGNQTITLSGDATGSGTTAIPVTLATVNSNVGTFQGLTVNGKGLVTAAVSTTGQIPGTNTNNNASAGNVGEYISSTLAVGSEITLSPNTATNITSISLTAGDWDVSGNVCFDDNSGGSAPTITYRLAAIGLVSATLPSPPNTGGYTGGAYPSAGAFNNIVALPVGPIRVSLASTSTVYLITYCAYTGTLKVYGFIGARRAR